MKATALWSMQCILSFRHYYGDILFLVFVLRNFIEVIKYLTLNNQYSKLLFGPLLDFTPVYMLFDF